MKKFYRRFCLFLFFAFVIISLFAGTMSVEITATNNDLFLYRLGAFFLFFVPALAFLIESNLFNVLQKLKIDKISKHILIWVIIIITAIISFSTCYSFTSQEFKDNMRGNDFVETTQESVEIITTSQSSEDTLQTIPSNETTTHFDEKTITENIEITTTETNDIELTTEAKKEDFEDIDGHIFTFENATYIVNGIEVTFNSVEFDKTSKNSNGYEMTFDYSAVNTNNTNATLKFSLTEGQFRCSNGTVVLSTSSLNAASNKYASSLSLKANEKNDKLVMFHALSNRFANRTNGIDYDVVEVGDIFSNEHVELDIVMTGWLGNDSETMTITFELN